MTSQIDAYSQTINHSIEYESAPNTCLRSVYSPLSYIKLIAKFKQYQIKTSLFSFEQLRSSENTKLKKSKNFEYYGEIINCKRNGIGIMICNNGSTYQGQWADDKKHGKGYEVLANGNTYDGSYARGKFQGYGKFKWQNGQSFEGEWINGLKNGSGIQKRLNGCIYMGQWKQDLAEGHGILIESNNNRYEGMFRKGLKQGQGVYKYLSQDVYKGQFKEDKPNGVGEYVWQNGSIYKGQFKDGLMNGRGTWMKSAESKRIFEGVYSKGKKNGFGKYTWQNGDFYHGNYAQNMRSGYGQMFWNDGTFYKGEWLDDQQNGKGIYFSKEQGIKAGNYKNNCFLVEEEYQMQQLNLSRKHDSQHKIGRQKIKSQFKYQPKRQQKYKTYKLSHNRKLTTQIKNNHRKDNIHTNNKFQLRKTTLKYNRCHTQPNYQTKNYQRLEKQSDYITHQNITKVGQRSPCKKQFIPHSSYYMHKLFQRTNIKGCFGNTQPIVNVQKIRNVSINKYKQTKHLNYTKLMNIQLQSSKAIKSFGNY